MQYFNNEEELDVYLEQDNFYDRHDKKYNGPGWYYITDDTEPCRRGCCSISILKIYPIKDRIDELEYEIQKLKNKQQELIEKQNENKRSNN